MRRTRLVVDTNALVSRLLLPNSIPAQAVRLAIDQGILLVSDVTLEELVKVLARPRFNSYVSLQDRQTFIEKLICISEKVAILQRIQACRDPKDDKFLEVAVNGKAAIIITGDRDLLALHPFMGISILTPAAFLQSTG